MSNDDEKYIKSVEDNIVDAFEYSERIYDFISEKYNVSNDDEFENTLDLIEDKNDYTTLEQVYETLCEKYPLIKENPTLNPKHRMVNSWFVFHDVCYKFLVRLWDKYDEDNEFEIHCNELSSEMKKLFPACTKLIELEIDTEKTDDYPDEYDDVWYVPKDELLNDQYKGLYKYLQHVDI